MQLLAHVRDAHEDAGDHTEAQRMLRDLLERGNGAHLQHAAQARSGKLCDVVADAVRRTEKADVPAPRPRGPSFRG
jgi:hypothetical protein